MPSGGGAHDGDGGADTVELSAAGAAEGCCFDRAQAMDPAGAATAGETFGRARTGAEAAMHAATSVGHGGLAATAAAAGTGAAAGRGQEIAGAVAIREMAAAVGREGGDGWRGRDQIGTMNPMPSGRRS